jgi:hypothetical protein
MDKQHLPHPKLNLMQEVDQKQQEKVETESRELL